MSYPMFVSDDWFRYFRKKEKGRPLKGPHQENIVSHSRKMTVFLREDNWKLRLTKGESVNIHSPHPPPKKKSYIVMSCDLSKN